MNKILALSFFILSSCSSHVSNAEKNARSIDPGKKEVIELAIQDYSECLLKVRLDDPYLDNTDKCSDAKDDAISKLKLVGLDDSVFMSNVFDGIEAVFQSKTILDVLDVNEE